MTMHGSIAKAQKALSQDRAESEFVISDAENGMYITFESPPGVPLKLESLENSRQGIELVATQRVVRSPGNAAVQLATVLVPDGKISHFIKYFDEYATQVTAKKGEPKHRDLVDQIRSLRRATLDALWTDSPDAFPINDDPIWWEVWLRKHDGSEVERLSQFAAQAKMTLGAQRLVFHDRIVVLLYGKASQFEEALDVLNDLAELRKAKEATSFFTSLHPNEQADWVTELDLRIGYPAKDSPAVCLLDTGVTREHPLLRNLIAPEDASAVRMEWGANDDGGGPACAGHGTEMAGIAAYGDLVPLLESNDRITMRHRLESIKILPAVGSNRPDLYGAITAQALAVPEIQAPQRRRVFSLAITAADQRDRGQPTSWSTAVDALIVGNSINATDNELEYLSRDHSASRLMVLSAGNVDPGDLSREHLNASDLSAVHDPAQAWNAITVGAYTQKVTITDEAFEAFAPVAPVDELSPWSSTSVLFQASWPIKPEVVFEGGNIAYNELDEIEFPVPDLCLLSTHSKLAEKLFRLSYATSAATAQAARMAANILAEYPKLWPETVRALLVHSAEWTPTMTANLKDKTSKSSRMILARRYGHGVPDLNRALRSARDALTLVIEESIRPFSKRKMREMHLHRLPWPREVLAGLGSAQVRLKVALSYYVEPNPGRRGWKKRHRYASHGLRFAVKRPTESVDAFRKRMNQSALDEDEDKPTAESDAAGWFLGEQNRNKGSLHVDTWVGLAADLAERGVIGVYPISGWWKEQPKHDRSENGCRYALVVSIETPEQDVDVWTPVAQEVGVPVEEVLVEV